MTTKFLIGALCAILLGVFCYELMDGLFAIVDNALPQIATY